MTPRIIRALAGLLLLGCSSGNDATSSHSTPDGGAGASGAGGGPDGSAGAGASAGAGQDGSAGAAGAGCSTGQTSCGGTCVSLEYDPQHCGSCDHACPGDLECNAKVCGCPTPKTACNNQCVDTTSDMANCGGCNQPCGVDGGIAASECNDGTCRLATPLATGVKLPTQIVVRGGYVYFGEILGNGIGQQDIRRVPVAGGPAEVVLDQMYNLGFLDVAGTELFTTGVGPVGRVMSAGETGSRLPVTGGTPVGYATVTDSTGMPVDLVVLGGAVYWTSYKISGGVASEGRIYSVPTGGGTTGVVATSGAAPYRIAVEGSDVFYTAIDAFDTRDGRVERAPTGGGTPTVIATAQPSPSRIVVDATDVYWCNEFATGGGAIVKAPRNATGPVTPMTVVSPTSGTRDLDQDAAYLYYSDYQQLLKVSKADGTKQVLYHGPDIAPITVDASDVYFATSDGQGNYTIYRMSK